MHIWTINKWEKNLKDIENRRVGLYFRFEKTVNPEVREACIRFAKWLRYEYYFPLRVPVYVKAKKSVKTKTGENVIGIFFEPFSCLDEPYIKIAVGDYDELKKEIGRDAALATILCSIAHEITHYYQWINNIQLTEIGRERQATQYSRFIVDEYSTTCEHP